MTNENKTELLSTEHNYQVAVGNIFVGITIKKIVGENDIFWEVCRPHGMIVSIQDSRITKFGYEYKRNDWWVTEGCARDTSIETLCKMLANAIH